MKGLVPLPVWGDSFLEILLILNHLFFYNFLFSYYLSIITVFNCEYAFLFSRFSHIFVRGLCQRLFPNPQMSNKVLYFIWMFSRFFVLLQIYDLGYIYLFLRHIAILLTALLCILFHFLDFVRIIWGPHLKCNSTIIFALRFSPFYEPVE